MSVLRYLNSRVSASVLAIFLFSKLALAGEVSDLCTAKNGIMKENSYRKNEKVLSCYCEVFQQFFNPRATDCPTVKHLKQSEPELEKASEKTAECKQTSDLSPIPISSEAPIFTITSSIYPPVLDPSRRRLSILTRERIFRLNTYNCEKDKFNNAVLAKELKTWKRKYDEVRDLENFEEDMIVNRNSIVGCILDKIDIPTIAAKLNSDLVMVCDESGELYTVGLYDLLADKHYTDLYYVVTKPELEKNGGTTAVLRHLIAQSLIQRKKGLRLSPYEEVKSFYENRGLSVQNPSKAEKDAKNETKKAAKDDEDSEFMVIKKKEFPRKFPEFAPFFQK